MNCKSGSAIVEGLAREMSSENKTLAKITAYDSMKGCEEEHCEALNLLATCT